MADELVVASVSHQEVRLGQAPQAGEVVGRDDQRLGQRVGVDELDGRGQQDAGVAEVQEAARGVLHPVGLLADAGGDGAACAGHLVQQHVDMVDAEELRGGLGQEVLSRQWGCPGQ